MYRDLTAQSGKPDETPWVISSKSRIGTPGWGGGVILNPGNIRSKNPKSWELKVVTGNPGDLNVLGAGRRPEFFRKLGVGS